jgi:hypothetical protein
MQLQAASLPAHSSLRQLALHRRRPAAGLPSSRLPHSKAKKEAKLEEWRQACEAVRRRKEAAQEAKQRAEQEYATARSQQAMERAERQVRGWCCACSARCSWCQAVPLRAASISVFVPVAKPACAACLQVIEAVAALREAMREVEPPKPDVEDPAVVPVEEPPMYFRKPAQLLQVRWVVLVLLGLLGLSELPGVLGRAVELRLAAGIRQRWHLPGLP